MAGVNQVFSLADDVAGYLKACGKSSVLQTKPVNPSQLKGLKLATKLESDVVEFSTKEIKLDDEMFDILPWKVRDCRKLPPTGKPPIYTSEAKVATETFIEKGWIEEPLPNGFRIGYGPSRRSFQDNGMFRADVNGLTDHEFLYYNEDSKGINLMAEKLKKFFLANPNITEEQKAETLYKYVDSCYSRGRSHWVSEFSHDFIPIENTAAVGSGVCRHKSLLAKVLGDKLGLNVAMVRGWYFPSKGIDESHMWNEVKIGKKWFLMDVEQNRFIDLEKFPEFKDFYMYGPHC